MRCSAVSADPNQETHPKIMQTEKIRLLRGNMSKVIIEIRNIHLPGKIYRMKWGSIVSV